MGSSVAIRRLESVALARAVALAVAAVTAGVLAAVHPLAVAVPLAALLLVAFTFLAPVTHLTLLLCLTAVVGFELQRGYAGQFLPSDALLLTGLLRAAVVIAGERIEPRRLLAAGLVLAFMGAVLLQLVHGLRTGNHASYAAAEARILLGFGVLLVTLPVVADPRSRERLARGLVVVGLLLGLWGLAQWSLGIQGPGNINLGVRTGVDFSVSGSGQLHGGLYGYPVAVVMASAALLSRVVRSQAAQLALAAVVVTNAACLLLTYERTFWFMTIVGLGFVIVKLGRGRRLRAVAFCLAAVALLFGVLAASAPRDFEAIRDRGLSLRQTSTDDSFRWRALETHQLVEEKIAPQPLFGWGLGDFLHWGKPWLQIPPASTWFAHNGYLWMVWKMGIPAAALLFVLLGWAVASRGPPRGGAYMRVFRTASQGGLLVLLLSSLSFPSFNSYSITAVMGALMAVCLAPLVFSSPTSKER